MSAKCVPKPDVVIVGGGPAGSAAAITIARSGAAVMLIEREAKPIHKVCGEFLSEEAVDVLHGLGIHLTTLGAPSIRNLRVSKRNGVFEIPLPFRAHSLSRRTLDEELLQKVVAVGGQVIRGQHVTGISRDRGEWRIQLRDGEQISAASVMLGTGKHDIVSSPRPCGTQNNLIGLKQYLYLRPKQRYALKEHIELHLFPGGYAGLQLAEDGTANLCCAATSSELTKGATRWQDLLDHMKHGSSLLRERLDGAIATEEKPLAIAPIPYGLVQSETEDGLWLLGDQAAVIPSYTGDGMSMALHSGVLAASAWIAGGNSKTFQAEYANAVRRQVNIATWISQRMVHPFEQQLAANVLRLSPNILQWIAKQTRLPETTRRSTLQAIERSLTSVASSSAK